MRTVTTPFSNPEFQTDAIWCAKMLDSAEPSAKLIGCSPEAIVAQAAQETGWGRASIGHNIFGIKTGSGWTGKKQLVTTREWNGTAYVTIQDWFRDYDTYEECFEDHFKFLKDDTRYASVFDPDNTKSDTYFFQQLQVDGYATDPNYAYNLGLVLKTVQMFEMHMTSDTAVS